MNDDHRYTSALSSKGALLEETLVVLGQIDQGRSIEDVRTMVVDQDLLGKTREHLSHLVEEHPSALPVRQ